MYYIINVNLPLILQAPFLQLGQVDQQVPIKQDSITYDLDKFYFIAYSS